MPEVDQKRRCKEIKEVRIISAVKIQDNSLRIVREQQRRMLLNQSPRGDTGR